MQITRENNKFVFSHAKPGSRAKDLADALSWLVDSGLVYKVCKVQTPSLPLKMNSGRNDFKLYMMDVGILRVMSRKSPGDVLTKQDEDRLFKEP